MATTRDNKATNLSKLFEWWRLGCLPPCLVPNFQAYFLEHWKWTSWLYVCGHFPSRHTLSTFIDQCEILLHHPGAVQRMRSRDYYWFKFLHKIIIIYTVVKVEGAAPKRWRLVRGQDKPIHASCSIYFPCGIDRIWKPSVDVVSFFRFTLPFFGTLDGRCVATKIPRLTLPAASGKALHNFIKSKMLWTISSSLLKALITLSKKWLITFFFWKVVILKHVFKDSDNPFVSFHCWR